MNTLIDSSAVSSIRRGNAFFGARPGTALLPIALTGGQKTSREKRFEALGQRACFIA